MPKSAGPTLSVASVHPAPWIRWAAHAVPLCALPSGIWRIALVLGLLPDTWYSRTSATIGIGESIYIVMITVISEALALLTLGLVSPWGERFPLWIPLLGGRPVPVLAAVLPAGFGAAAVTALCGWYFLDRYQLHIQVDPLIGSEKSTDTAISTAGEALLAVCYAPLLAWGPLLAIVTFAYYHRRTKQIPEKSM